MNKVAKSIGIFFMITTIFVGCAQKSEDNKEEVILEDKLNFEDKANEVLVLEDTVQFIDGLGENKVLNKNPQRVVSLYTSHTVLWYEAGGEVVGRIQTETSDAQLPEEALMEDIEIVATSSSASNISIESVIEFEPDLVILGTAMSQPSLVEALEVAGVESVVVDYEDVDDYLKWFKVFSSLNNKDNLYDEIAKTTLDDILVTLDKVKNIEDTTTVLNIYSSSKSLTANLSTSTIGAMIDAIGGVNIADSWNNPEGATRLDISMEAVLAANPDKILIQHSQGEEIAREMVENTYGNNLAWQELDAVKNGEVYYLDINLFHYKANSNYNKAYEELGKILYPEVF